jgi:hypothetical protein
MLSSGCRVDDKPSRHFGGNSLIVIEESRLFTATSSTHAAKARPLTGQPPEPMRLSISDFLAQPSVRME